MGEVLNVKNIKKTFPGVKALENINFNLKKGEVHALVGENGAGKSTLMKILSGVHSPDEGEIFLEQEKIEPKSPQQAQNLGISIIYQEFSLVSYLNSVDNIFLGREIKYKNGLLNRKLMRKKTKDTLNRIGANINLNKPVGELSIAQQQFIEIAKAISIDENVLIFDEPTASLTQTEVENLFSLINNLKNRGVSIIYISHHLDEIFQLCDRVTCLRDGKVINTKKTSDTSKQELIKTMVGRDLVNIYPDASSNENKKKLLQVENMTNENVKNIQFYVNSGEILGIAGLVGAGRTETARALIGADKSVNKEIYIKEQKVNIKSPIDAYQKGICLIPENRKTQGLVLDTSVKNNISLPSLKKILNRFNLINRSKENEKINKLIKDLLIKTPSANQKVKSLSGGNQQKVVLAKWLGTECNIFIFDEPTRGIDIGAKEEIYKLMRELTEKGMGVIMISSELPEVLGMSDRIMVMHDGEMKAEIKKDKATSENIMFHATGGEKIDKIR